MVEAGMHLGHRTNKWNPKMKPYIYKEENNIHIVDLIQTFSHTIEALKFVEKESAIGKTVMFVGTKVAAKNSIAKMARKCDSFYVNEKWVGGILTNWDTFKKLTGKLLLLERQERNGFLEKLPKKERSKKLKEKEKLARLFTGIKYMKKLPDIVIIVGQPKELNALNECNRLNIRSITLVDTDCNPTIADLIIPANDDSVSAIKLLLNEFAIAITEGQIVFEAKMKHQKQQKHQNKKQYNRQNKFGRKRFTKNTNNKKGASQSKTKTAPKNKTKPVQLPKPVLLEKPKRVQLDESKPVDEVK